MLVGTSTEHGTSRIATDAHTAAEDCTALRSAKIYLQQDNWPLANLNRIDESEHTFARATVLDTRR